METRFIDTIFILNHECMQEKNIFCEKLNVSSVEFDVVDLLTKDEKVSCKAIANRIKLSLSRSSRIIDSLVGKNIILRKEDAENRKYKQVFFTPKGEKLKDKIEVFKNECEKKILSRFKPGEQKTIQKSIDKIYKIIKEYE